MNGLKTKIRVELRMMNPSGLEMAHQIEEKNKLLRKDRGEFWARSATTMVGNSFQSPSYSRTRGALRGDRTDEKFGLQWRHIPFFRRKRKMGFALGAMKNLLQDIGAK